MSVVASIALFAAEDGATEFHAENTWLPEASEILWGTIAFLIILALLIKFAGKPIAASLRGRTERIANEIESAVRARADAETEVARVRQNLADVDTERARIVAAATETAQRMQVEGLARNDAEVAELEARADADIATMRNRAAGELQGQVAQWASEATERIVVARLDDATVQRLVEDFIAKVGAAS
jgi:F-type H+-transporting ATPase subunit b